MRTSTPEESLVAATAVTVPLCSMAIIKSKEKDFCCEGQFVKQRQVLISLIDTILHTQHAARSFFNGQS